MERESVQTLMGRFNALSRGILRHQLHLPICSFNTPEKVLFKGLFFNLFSRIFEDVVRYCDGMKKNIPVSFLLGFFVSGVVGRWYRMYMYIPWMNHIAYTTMVTLKDKLE